MSPTADVAERLARLDPEQRAAATAQSGPVLCVAPAGSGKTATLVARIAWLVGEGTDPGTITALTFNRRAAEELSERLAAALPAPSSTAGDVTDRGPLSVRVRTFHALGLEILREAGEAVTPLVDREATLRHAIPDITSAMIRRLDTLISRFKLELAISPEAIAADPEAGPLARAFVAYEREIAKLGGLDFDDLIVRSVQLLESRTDALDLWRTRCSQLLVDEAQDLDRMQLRMALLLAAPSNKIFLVGDDDQSIYGWRLADVRRLLALAETWLPDLRRLDLATNYRCPAPVVERAVRLVAHNRERFVKTIRARPVAPGRLVLAPAGLESLDTCIALLDAWPQDELTRAFLARTNRELLPAVAACLARDVPFHARDLELPVESPLLDDLLKRVASAPPSPLVIAVGAARRAAREIGEPAVEVATSLMHWAPGHADLDSLRAAIEDTRARLARFRRDDARLTLATVHGTKGLEFDHVAVIGLDAGRFPSARSVADADDPDRALEEERRLAYVAWTRARRTLTLSFDPASPSQFLLEAFDPEELPGTA